VIVFMCHSYVVSLWQNLTEFNILHIYVYIYIYTYTGLRTECLLHFILCPFLLLWIRSNQCNPHHPQWCLVVNVLILVKVEHPIVPYVYKIKRQQPSNTVINQPILLG
jgi:hypothetical protein